MVRLAIGGVPLPKGARRMRKTALVNRVHDAASRFRYAYVVQYSLLGNDYLAAVREMIKPAVYVRVRKIASVSVEIFVCFYTLPCVSLRGVVSSIV